MDAVVKNLLSPACAACRPQADRAQAPVRTGGGDLNVEAREFLQQVIQGMSLVADISRSDMLLYRPIGDQEARLVAQARPHSLSPIHSSDLVGRRIEPQDEPYVFQVLRWGRSVQGERVLIPGTAPIVQVVHPIRTRQGQLIGALSRETHMFEHKRQQHRRRPFQRALRWLRRMLLRGELRGVEGLSPFGEYDGIIVVNTDKRILYMSGIATNLYRRLGYLKSLVGQRLSDLDTADESLASQVMEEGVCLEEETQERERILIRKAIPLLCRERNIPWLGRYWLHSESHPVGVMLAIHDATEVRERERELRVKTTMIQEIHHRIKNNLQTVAALLRMQSRRVSSKEARMALEEGVGRILGMAVVHQFLSQGEGQTINIRDVARRILTRTERGMVDPEKEITMELAGPNLYLPAEQATACTLIINELLQNALEHGYESRKRGRIDVILEDRGNQVRIRISDDGRGLPEDFSPQSGESLGLEIVQRLVEDDLGGTFELRDEDGVSATILFPKPILGGNENWNGHA
ncbi:MAG: histidine kinase N-terminal domain-containing protein [Chloroflexota bacterium]|nr:histidine kinase N-terminal domain-containing protein [Chloroflexota bacterium]